MTVRWLIERPSAARLTLVGWLAVGSIACGSDGAERDAGITDAGTDPRPDVACVPTTCAVRRAECGRVTDGCGGMLNCGDCDAPETCAGGGAANQCGCTPRTCSEAGAECGDVDDGCGGVQSCGMCADPAVCGESVPNVCGIPCDVTACAEAGADCGTIEAPCGTVGCGVCASPATCGGDGRPNVCGVCVPITCADLGVECGPVDDGCGVTIDCGSCEAPETCGGGGAPGICGCTPRSCAEMGRECGPVDNGCGAEIECGSCVEPEFCGGSWIEGVCGINRDIRCTADGWCGAARGPAHGIDAVFGFGPDDVWAGGGGRALHWDGRRWEVTDGPGGRAIHGSDPSNLWIGASRLTPTGWVSEPTGTADVLMCSWFFSPMDGWTFTHTGQALRWNGTAWAVGPAPGVSRPLGAFGLAADHLFVVGSSGDLNRWNGTAWTPERSTPTILNDVWAHDASNVWIVGNGGLVEQRVGASWVDRDAGFAGNVHAVWGFSPSDVWASAYDGTTRHWNGSMWDRIDRVTHGAWIEDLWGSSPSDLWAVGRSGAISHFNGSTWTRHTHGEALFGDAVGVWASSATEIVVVADTLRGIALERWNGSEWDLVIEDPIGDSPQCAWGLSANELWIAGDDGGSRGAIHRWDGTTMTMVTRADYIVTDIDGSSATNVWAVAGSESHHFNGSVWREYPIGTPAGSAYGVWVGGPGVAWAVGSGGRTYRLASDGTSWELVDTGTTLTLLDVWGTSTDSLWATSQEGVLLHWDGTAWSMVATPPVTQLWRIHGSSERDIWIAADEGSVLHWDGVSWDRQLVGVEQVDGVRVTPEGDVVAFGRTGFDSDALWKVRP